MTRAEYLSVTLSLGMSVKEAMLAEIAEINQISKIRERQHEEARERSRSREPDW